MLAGQIVIKEKVESARLAAIMAGSILFLLFVVTDIASKGVEDFLSGDPIGPFMILPMVVFGFGFVFLKMFRLRKFGRSNLLLEGNPAPGGVLKGRLKGRLDASIDDPLCFSLQLVGYHLRLRYDGDGSRKECVILWCADQMVFPGQWMTSGERQVEVPFSFDVPSCVQVEMWKSFSNIHWRLEANRELPGADYLARFRVPMALPELEEPDEWLR